MNDQENNFGILLSDQNGKASKNQLKLNEKFMFIRLLLRFPV